MDRTPWILLDTETTGFKAPIHVVELAAQRLRGWEPEGPPFRRLLNHGVAIPPEAARVNGYTREILERDGDPPQAVYDAFAVYAGNRPLVAYNLSYDLEDVLRPEWQRLGRAPIGQAGFCALRLAQRLLDPVPAGNCKLQTLRQYYRLPERGAHTALGDVETVADLLRQVLRPLAEARGLMTWAALCAFTTAPWFPSRLAFGKYKGRLFQDARDDPDLRGWLQWLARSSNPRSAAMGRWYLAQLTAAAPSARAAPATLVIEAGADPGQGVVLYRNPEREILRRLIEDARARLADLEAEATREQQAVAAVQARLFSLLRPHYERRDTLRRVIDYRHRYLDTLLTQGEEEAEAVKPAYQQARAEAQRDYEEAAAEARERKELSDAEAGELQTLFRKLVRLYHPDRFAHDPAKQAIHERLTQAINQARDRGDLQRLREIANDPHGFLMRQGWGRLNWDDDEDLGKLQRLYGSLQARILTTLDALARLRESSDYALYRLSREQPDLIQTVAEQQAQAINAEIGNLEEEARQLAEEITRLSGTADHIAD